MSDGERSPRTVAVLLAGGGSGRMGRPKALLLDDRGRTFLDRLARIAFRGGCDAVLVVVGRHAGEIAAALPADVLLVRNPRWEQGQLSSARAGISAALMLGAERLLIHPVDQPLVRAADFAAVLLALDHAEAAVASFRGEPGHPLGLTGHAARRILTDRRSATLRDSVSRRLAVPVPVAASKGCLRGANTPEELAALFGRAPPPDSGR